MTHIVDFQKYPSKKKFREAVERDPARVIIYDPHIITGGKTFSAEQIVIGEIITVTNHPKRSWFAAIERKDDKTLVVN